MDTIIFGNETILTMMYMLCPKRVKEFDACSGCGQMKRFWNSIKSEELRGAEMKPSVFNFVEQFDGGCVVCNTLYNSLVRLTDLEYEKLLGNRKCGRQLARKFLLNGLAVTKDIDERAAYAAWRERVRRNANYLSVNITTTLDCNARCRYCYEAGVRHEDFAKDKLEPLVKFIVKRKSTRPVKLNWFGGEPLMRPDVIDFVCRRLDEEGIEYQSYLITNGSLITKRMIERQFQKWHLTDVQITLDGTASNYEARKQYLDKRRGSFGRILDRIESSAAKVIVHIRLNIDNENANDILELLKVLQSRFAGNDKVTYYPAFLTGIDETFPEDRKVDYVRQMFELVNNPKKFGMGVRMYSTPRSLACMRNDPNSFSIDVNGRVYSCEHEVGRPERSVGTLTRLNRKKIAELAGVPLRAECSECVFLPKCMGGCSINLETDDSPCMIEKYIIQAYARLLID